MTEPRSSELSDALARMSRDLLVQQDAQRTLDRIVEHAHELIGGCEHAGILLMRGNEVDTPAATSDLVRESDRLQAEFGEGPCFDAVVHNQPVYRLANINERVSRWPRYAPHARELGIASMAGFELYTSRDVRAALDVYSAQPHAFDERAEHTGWLLSSHAALAVAATRPQDERLPALQRSSR